MHVVLLCTYMTMKWNLFERIKYTVRVFTKSLIESYTKRRNDDCGNLLTPMSLWSWDSIFNVVIDRIICYTLFHKHKIKNKLPYVKFTKYKEIESLILWAELCQLYFLFLYKHYNYYSLLSAKNLRWKRTLKKSIIFSQNLEYIASVSPRKLEWHPTKWLTEFNSYPSLLIMRSDRLQNEVCMMWLNSPRSIR